MMSDRRHTRLITEYGGIKSVMPKLTAAFLIITLSSVGLPSMNGFVGEFLIMLGAFKWDPKFVVIAGLGVILSAVYMLWMFQRVFYGPVTNDHNKGLPDLSVREWAIVGPLAAMAIFMGVFPNVFLRPMEPAVRRIVERVQAHQPASARLGSGELRRGKPAAHPSAPDSTRPHLTAPASTRPHPPAPVSTRPHPPGTCPHGGRQLAMFSNAFDAVIPVVCVTLAGLVVMLAEAFRGKDERMPLGGLAIIGLVGAGAASILLWDRNATSFGVVTADNFALFVNLVIIVVGIFTVVVSSQTVERDHMPAGEYYAILLFALVGMMLMAQATDLLLVFLALETMSIALYVLTGIRREVQQSTEAAFKYFLLGAFASSFFLYGVAFLYGVTGSTSLDRIGAVIAAQSMSGNPMILLGVGLLLVGFAFKIAAVPFHMWSPDAYEGAPAVVTGFMSTGVKAAAIASFARVFLSALEPMIADWAPVLWVIAAATMIIGTVVGVAQTSLKRMLAYSSIAHGGYLLLGILAGNDVGKAAILYYLAAYALTNLGAFGIIALLGSRDRANDDLRDYAGLWNSHPALAALMTMFLLSLGGFPPTAGFIAKWYVFSAAVGAGYYGLAIIGVLSSVVSVFFYLRVVVMMYMHERDARPLPPPVTGVAMAGLAISLAGVIYLGVLPARVLDWAQASVATIF